MFGEFIEAEEEYEEGLDTCPPQLKWEYLVNWAISNFTIFSITTDMTEILPYLNKSLLLLDAAIVESGREPNHEYALLSINNVKAFIFMIMNDEKSARQVYKADLGFVKAVPVDDFNNKKKLQFLFANYFKGLAVAIELKDKKLLMKLLTIISIDDGVLLGNHSLFKKFYVTMIDTFDTREEFGTEFNTLFRLCNNFKEPMPVYRNFLELMSKPDFEGLDKLFSEFS